MKEGIGLNSNQLLTARELEALGVMKKGTAWRMARAGMLNHYAVGCNGGGIRFLLSEVLETLRRPAAHEVSK